MGEPSFILKRAREETRINVADIDVEEEQLTTPEIGGRGEGES